MFNLRLARFKKILLASIFLLICGPAIAQITSSVNGTVNPLATGVVAGSQINLLPGSSTNVTLTFTILGAPATFSAQMETSTNNGSTYSNCGQAITATSGTQTINCAGVFDHAQFDITVATGGTTPSVVWGMTATAPLGGGLNPCQNSNFVISSVAVNIASATTTQLVAPLTGAKITVCGFAVSLTGTTPTMQLEYGTGGTCGTGTVVLTGAYAPLTGSVISYGIGGSSLKSSAASAGLCLISGGTAPSIQGVLTYVQQ